MGSAGIFASGTGLLELKGGVVIASKNPALSRAAVAKLAARAAQVGRLGAAGLDPRHRRVGRARG